MAVMTSQMPPPLDGSSDPISHSSVRNRRNLRSLIANSASRTKSLPPGVQRNTLPAGVVARPPVLPLSSAQADSSQSQTFSSSQTRPKSTSVSVTSSARPSPRFHVTNPTELPPSTNPNKASAAKSHELNRPLPAPVFSTGSGSEGKVARQQSGPPSPPRINTTGLHLQSPPSSAASNCSPFPSESNSTASSTSSSTSFTPKRMSKVILPIGPTHVPAPLPLYDASLHNERTTPVSALPSPSGGTRSIVRPLPPPPPLPKVVEASLAGPQPRSSSRGASPKVRSRNNSAVGRGDAISRPQLSFDPTSSSYVIRTANEVNGHFSAMSSGVESIKSGSGSRSARMHTHNRSHSAQTKNFSSMTLHDVRDIRDTSSSVSSSNDYSVVTRKGKQVVRSAPCSDTEEGSSPLSKSARIRQTRQKLVLHNPSSSVTVRSAPTSDAEDSPTYELTSSPLLLPPTGSIKDMLPKPLTIRTDNILQPLPTRPAFLSAQSNSIEPLTVARRASPPNLAQGSTFKLTSPPPLPSVAEDIGYADAGFVDDSRVYADDGFDGPGGLGAFSTSVDPDVDLDIGEMVFNSRPPSGEFMGPSVMDLDMDARGRHVSRPTPVPRWKSADSHATNADLQKDEHGKPADTKSRYNASRGSRSASQAVIMSSFKAHVHVHPVHELELGPSPINMDLEPEMVFSKNPRSFTPLGSVPGVLDMGERRYIRGKWRSPSPVTPTGAVPPRNPAAGQFAPVRARGFYEDW